MTFWDVSRFLAVSSTARSLHVAYRVVIMQPNVSRLFCTRTRIYTRDRADHCFQLLGGNHNSFRLDPTYPADIDQNVPFLFCMFDSTVWEIDGRTKSLGESKGTMSSVNMASPAEFTCLLFLFSERGLNRTKYRVGAELLLQNDRFSVGRAHSVATIAIFLSVVTPASEGFPSRISSPSCPHSFCVNAGKGNQVFHVNPYGFPESSRTVLN